MLYWLVSDLGRYGRTFVRLGAQRRIWSAGTALSITAVQRTNAEEQSKGLSAQTSSRWMEYTHLDETAMTLYDIILSINARARTIAAAYSAKDIAAADAAMAKADAVSDINDLLLASGIPVTLAFEADRLMASQGAATYDASTMSDGERNVMFMAGRVLTAEPESNVVIDEPERHLHRSIIKPLILAMMRKRPDCLFVVATHELELSTEFDEGNTLLVRSCLFSNDVPTAWDCDLLGPGDEFDETTKREILGARRRIIYCEGKPHSLDLPLFALLFPDASVIAKDNCREVEKAVKGVRGAHAHVWVKGFGVIDNDGRTPDDPAALEAQGVFALTASTVECIYYHPKIVRRMATRQYASIGRVSAAEMTAEAKRATLQELTAKTDDLAAKVATHEVRALVSAQLPKEADVKAGNAVILHIDTAAKLAGAKAALQALLTAEDWAGVVERFGVRATGAMGRVAGALSFPSKADYESAVRRMLSTDADARSEALAFFGNLSAALAAS